MEHKRDGLVPIGDALSGMGGPVKAIRAASPQALHHFTRFDQVNQLVSGQRRRMPPIWASWRERWRCARCPAATPATGKSTSASTDLSPSIMVAGGGNKLPYGNLPRLILAWVSTEAVRTQSRELVLGRVAFRVHADPRHIQQRRGQPPNQAFAIRCGGSLVARCSLIYED